MSNEDLRISARGVGDPGFVRIGLYFDIRDDIQSTIEELEKRGSGYKETIEAAERLIDDEGPEYVYQMLSEALDNAKLIDGETL